MTSSEISNAVFVWKRLNGIAFRTTTSQAFVKVWSTLPQSYRNDYLIRAKVRSKGIQESAIIQERIVQ